MKKGQKRADFDMERCNFLCFGSAIWSLCQKLLLLENVCTTNCALPVSQNCVFIWFQAIYIYSDMIALTSEYHLHARNSLLTEINRCRVASSGGFVNNYIFGKNVHIELCPLKCIKTAFSFSLWPHMHLNMITPASVYHFHSRN